MSKITYAGHTLFNQVSEDGRTRSISCQACDRTLSVHSSILDWQLAFLVNYPACNGVIASLPGVDPCWVSTVVHEDHRHLVAQKSEHTWRWDKGFYYHRAFCPICGLNLELSTNNTRRRPYSEQLEYAFPARFLMPHLEPFTPPVKEQEGESQAEMVNSPSHYKPGTFEVYKVLHEWGIRDPRLWNAMKYGARCGVKHANPLEDLKKAYWYLGLYIWDLEGKDIHQYADHMRRMSSRA